MKTCIICYDGESMRFNTSQAKEDFFKHNIFIILSYYYNAFIVAISILLEHWNIKLNRMNVLTDFFIAANHKTS